MAVGPELRLLNLHFFNICRHHPTLKFKPHATDDERYVSGIDGVPLIYYRKDIQVLKLRSSLGIPSVYFSMDHMDSIPNI